MKQKIIAGLFLLMPLFAFAQAAPSADQNYCTNNVGINAPFGTYVSGLCNASRSMLVTLYSYTTPAASAVSRGENALLSAFMPSKAPAPQAPAAPAAPAPSNAPAVNPYNYS